MPKKIFIGAIVALILLGVGVFIGTKIPRKIVTSNGSQNDSFQAGWDAAKERLSQSSMVGDIPAGIEVKNVSGMIQKIDGNKLTVKINPIELLADANLNIRIITVDASTKITLAVQKDPAQLQKEMQEFQDKMKQQQPGQTNLSQAPALTVPLLPPMPFDKKDISLADLKENQQVTVTANENIREKKEFTAVQIDAQEGSIVSSPAALPPSAALPASPAPGALP